MTRRQARPVDATVPARRSLLVLAAALATLALLLPLVPPGVAHGQDAEQAMCPDDPRQAEFLDRDEVADVHLASVDCMYDLGIVEGFEDTTYRPAVQVRRDQLASFVYRVLREADVLLPEPAEERFSDVEPGSVHDEAIHVLKAAGIAAGGAGGLGPDEFAPGLLMRRDQLVSFLARPIAFVAPEVIDLNEQMETRFPDVPASNVHSGNIEQTADFGIVQGFTDGTFRPAQGVRRDQMASFMARLLELLPNLPPLTGLRLDASSVGVRPDDPVTMTARVAIEGVPVVGTEVAFTTSGAAAAPSEGRATTDDAGMAEFTFTSSEEGTVFVTAETTVDGEVFTDDSSVAFVRPIDPPIRLLPEDETFTVGTAAEFTATRGRSTDEAVVVFEVHRDNAARDALTLPRVEQHVERSVEGEATFTYTSEEPRHDVVVACLTTLDEELWPTASCNDGEDNALARNPGGDDFLNIVEPGFDTVEVTWEAPG